MGAVTFDTNVQKTVDITKTVELDVDKDVVATVDLEGSLATAEAAADAFFVPQLTLVIEGVLSEGDNRFSGGSFSAVIVQRPFSDEGVAEIMSINATIADASGDEVVGSCTSNCGRHEKITVVRMDGTEFKAWRTPEGTLTIPAVSDGVPVFEEGVLDLTFEQEAGSGQFVFAEGFLSLPAFGEDLVIADATLLELTETTGHALAEVDTFTQVSELGAFAFAESLSALSFEETDTLIF